MLPSFISFTGVDLQTSSPRMMALAADYPVEFAFLLSPSRQGTGRFPPREFIHHVLSYRNSRFKFAAHLIDEYSAKLVETQMTGLEASGDLKGFERVQINSDSPDLSPKKVRKWADTQGIVPILQCTQAFPADQSVQWLFDPSKGTGTRPASWPAARGTRLVGYAGGIGPDNVAEVVGQIGQVARNYWIDMASGVRGADHRFDLGKCRQVCEAVYGPPHPA